ncbi:MAG: histidine kinase [Bacteroidetes bacterium]|nr:histidine kinase [Bacteroidota bacterium]
MNKLLCFLILLLGLLCGNSTSAQEPVFRNIGINQGLPSSEVYRIIQDKKGIIWFSTDAGVCSFNGHSIKCYTTADGLPDNTVFDLVEDAKGRIWMNCYNGTLCYFENEKFVTIAASQELKKILKETNSLITSIQLDGSQSLWIGTSVNLYFVPAAKNYSEIKKYNSHYDSSQCVIKVLDNDKTIESTTRNSVQLISGLSDRGQIYFQINKNDNNLTAVLFKTNLAFNPKFCSLFSKDKKVVYTYRNYLFKQLAGNKQKQLQFPKTIISINEDPAGNLWVGLAKGGVYFFKKGDLNTIPKVYFENYSISSTHFDRENGVWLSTFEKGIFYAPSANYFCFPQNEELSSNIAGLGLFGSKIYVGTTGNSIYAISNDIELLKMPASKETNLSSVINFFPFGNKLVCGGNKLALFDTIKNNFVYPQNKNNITYFGTCFSKNEEGNLVFVAQGGYYEFKNNRVELAIKLPSRGTSLFRSRSGEMYLGTLIGLYQLLDTEFVPVDNVILSNERVNCIAGDKANRLYVGTKNKGLFINAGNKWISVTKENGLSSDICNFIFCDDADTVWVATNKGISFFNSSTPNKIQTITISNGLPTNEISSLARRGNQLFVGTREGLCMINLNQNLLNLIPPNIFISKAIESKKSEIIQDHCVLTYNQNNLTFFIECPTFKNLFSPSYTYVLKGYSDSIRKSEKENLEFQNLEPGEYSLIVKGVNNNGMQSKAAAVFSFTINPPFWKTGGFIFFEIVLAALLIYLIVIWRINKVRKQERIKTEMNAAITESRMTALQAQMNPHFIFNAINSIQSFILNNDTQNAYDYLAKFAKLVRLVLNNSKLNTIKLETEIETLQLYVQMEQIRFKNSFDFIVSLDKSIDDISEISIPVMLVQPFIENAIWHGIMPLQEKRKGKIELKITQNEHYLQITIEDNGVGRVASEKSKTERSHKSLGMQLVAERLGLIESNGNQKANMEVVDLSDDKNQALGTRIVINLPNTNDERY